MHEIQEDIIYRSILETIMLIDIKIFEYYLYLFTQANCDNSKQVPTIIFSKFYLRV